MGRAIDCSPVAKMTPMNTITQHAWIKPTDSMIVRVHSSSSCNCEHEQSQVDWSGTQSATECSTSTLKNITLTEYNRQHQSNTAYTNVTLHNCPHMCSSLSTNILLLLVPNCHRCCTFVGSTNPLSPHLGAGSKHHAIWTCTGTFIYYL